MKGQITLELMIAFAVFVIAVHVLVSAQVSKNTELEKKILLTNEAMKADSISAFCNLMYLKGPSVEFAYFPRTDVEQSSVHCFSDGYYFTGESPSVPGVRLWF